MCSPYQLLTNQEFILLWNLLISSNLDIKDINKFRGLIDSVKLGGLLNNLSCKVIGLYISDVVGDDIRYIGSGPTVVSEPNTDLESFPDFSRLENTLQTKILKLAKIKRNIRTKVTNYLLVPQTAFAHQYKKFLGQRIDSIDLKLPPFHGNYMDVADHILKTIINEDFPRKKTFVFTGESVVPISTETPGIGGRNQHLLLYLYKLILEKTDYSVLILSFGTDGMDGNSKYAGGWLTLVSLSGQEKNQYLQNIQQALARFDSTNFLLPDNVIETGPTGINFADIVLVHVF